MVILLLIQRQSHNQEMFESEEVATRRIPGLPNILFVVPPHHQLGDAGATRRRVDVARQLHVAVQQVRQVDRVVGRAHRRARQEGEREQARLRHVEVRSAIVKLEK